MAAGKAEVAATNPKLDERVGATPAIADNTLYIRTAGHMPIVPVKPGRREGPFHGPCRARVSLGKQRRAIENAARALLSSSTSCRQAIRTLVRWTDGRVPPSGTNPLVADQES